MFPLLAVEIKSLGEIQNIPLGQDHNLDLVSEVFCAVLCSVLYLCFSICIF